MDSSLSAAHLVDQIRDRDEAAAKQVFLDYGQRLIAIAEKHLSRKLAGRLDGEDVVQSVFRTFFRRTEEGQFQIDSSVQLWRLLVTITVLKSRAKARQHTAGPRDVDAESAAGSWLAEVAGSQPGPAEAAELIEQVEMLLDGLPSLYGQILEMRLQGHDDDKIADDLNISRRTIQRATALMEKRLRGDAEQTLS